MRQRAKIDANHVEIVDALRAEGWLVWSTAALGKGFPDLLCGKQGKLVLVEVKDGSKPPSKRRLTQDELVAHARFKAHGIEILVVERVEDLGQLE
jgi:Holliday junction resolvase